MEAKPLMPMPQGTSAGLVFSTDRSAEGNGMPSRRPKPIRIAIARPRRASNASVAAAEKTLKRQAAWMRQHSSVTITVEGHADERGTREYNLALSERRATSVKNFLVALGVSSSRIATISYGKERPDALGHTEAAWSQNRRGVSVVN